MRKLTSRAVALASGTLLSIALLVSACEFGIVEPEDREPRVWNSLDQTVDTYMVADDENATRSFVVSLPPNETYVWENPRDEWGCVDTNLVAVLDGRDIDYRDTDERFLCDNDEWAVVLPLPGEDP
jgi:hypothetical protein